MVIPLIKYQWNIIKLVLILPLISMALFSYAQPTDSLPVDPASISVTTVQNLSFGAFTHANAGGTVTISTNGTRSISGDVIALNLAIPFYQGVFDIDAPMGAIISIMNGPDATLIGSNGGTMTVHLGSSDPVSPFTTVVTQPQKTPVNIGGTLTVGNLSGSPPGSYTGFIYITFNRE
ncbi:MAG: DUF4402 domain-containing protein [Chitinophagaceae bacterium]